MVNFPTTITFPSSSAVWDQAADGGVTVGITIERAPSGLQVAPEFVRFKPTMSGFDTNVNQADTSAHQPALVDKYYFWDFGESYAYTAPTQVAAVDAVDGGDRTDSRYAIGFHGDHVYRDYTTTHTVRLAVYEPSSGKWGQATTTISTGNPDTLYSGTATLFVDTNGAGGNYPNSPSGATNYDNLDSALTALNAASTPHRIVLERGQTHNRSSVFTFQPASGATVTFRIEAVAGAGAKPIINSTQSSGLDGALFADRTKNSAGGTSSSSVFKDLDLRSTWDTTTESGYWDCTLIDNLDFAGDHTVIDGCALSNCLRGVSVTTISNADRQLAVVDTTITDWSDYGIWGAAIGNGAILGCRIAQNVDALAGGPKDETHNNHGPLRFTDATALTVASCDLFSNTGWTTLGSQQSIQPCLRSHTSTGGPGRRSVITHNVMEGANQCYNPAAANSSSNDHIQNTLVEGNLMVSGHQAQRVINLSNSGMRIRNNILVMANPTTRDRNPTEFVNGDELAGTSSTDNNTGPIVIENNDLINLTTSAMAVFNTEGTKFSGDVSTANMIHEPNLGSPNTPYTPLSAVALITPRYKGYQDDGQALQTNRATPASGGERQEPQTGSTALDGNGDQVVGAGGFTEDYTA